MVPPLLTIKQLKCHQFRMMPSRHVKCVKSKFPLPKFSLYIQQVHLVFRAATPQEIAIQGLTAPASQPDIQIRNTPGKGRGVFVQEDVPKGTFLFEYLVLFYSNTNQRKCTPENSVNWRRKSIPSTMSLAWFWKWKHPRGGFAWTQQDALTHSAVL